MAESHDELGETPSSGAEAVAAALALAPGARPRARKAAKGPEARNSISAQEVFLRAESRKLHMEVQHLRLRHFDQRLSVGLKLLTIAFGALVVVGIAAMTWSAAHDRGLVVAAFSTPPDVAQRGLTGQVIAGQLIDELERLQAETRSSRPAGTYVDDWGEDIKVEIPETGISVSELQRTLTRFLGHETRISGALYRTADGIAVTVRVGANAGATFQGPDASLPALMQRAADSVYRQTQPYRYAVHLSAQGRFDEAKAIFSDIAESDASKEDRAWAYLGWATVLTQQGDLFAAAEKGRISARLYPQGLADAVVAAAESDLDHEEAALQATEAVVRVLEHDPPPWMSPRERADKLAIYRAQAANWRADPAEAARQVRTTPFTRVEGQAPVPTYTRLAGALASDHDASGALIVLQQGSHEVNPHFALPVDAVHAFIHSAVEDWAGVRDDWLAVQARLTAGGPGDERLLSRNIWAPLAYAYAQLGQIAEADALIARTPVDCDECARVRGDIAMARRDWAEAARWYDIVARRAPSSPAAPYHWGQMLLAKGDLDAAIGKFQDAHRRSPHFADPVESWGEALMRKGDFEGAVGRFAAAEADAPRWGRLHLKWSEALARLGRHDAARAQHQATAGMDLSVADKAEFAAQRL